MPSTNYYETGIRHWANRWLQFWEVNWSQQVPDFINVKVFLNQFYTIEFKWLGCMITIIMLRYCDSYILPFEYRTLKISVFRWIRYLGVRYSDGYWICFLDCFCHLLLHFNIQSKTISIMVMAFFVCIFTYFSSTSLFQPDLKTVER